MQDLIKEDFELVEEAKNKAKQYVAEMWEGERISSVATCVRMKSGKTYSGPNIFHPHSAPASMCAENTALAVAYAAGEREADTLATYHYHDEEHQEVVSPCGSCREFLRLFGDPWIVFNDETGLKKSRLSELLPESENF